jgi:hypothetical protein
MVIGLMGITIFYYKIVFKHLGHLFFCSGTGIFANYKTKLFV